MGESSDRAFFLFRRTNYKAKIDPAIHSGRRHHSFLVRAHRSEIMFGVLVEGLGPNRVAELSLSTGEF
jgi:hypothetical protein